MEIDKKSLLKLFINAKIHLGCKQQQNSETPFFVLGVKKNNSIIDLNITYYNLKRSFYFLVEAVSKFQTVLIVSDNSHFLKNYCLFEAKNFAYYWDFKKWHPGFLTNFKTIFLDFKQKQINLIEDKETFALKHLKHRPEILLVFDAFKHQDVINEAYSLNMPIIAIADTNCNQELLSKITYLIPANVNSLKSILFLNKFFVQALFNGRRRFKKRYMFLKTSLVTNKKQYGK